MSIVDFENGVIVLRVQSVQTSQLLPKEIRSMLYACYVAISLYLLL